MHKMNVAVNFLMAMVCGIGICLLILEEAYIYAALVGCVTALIGFGVVADVAYALKEAHKEGVALGVDLCGRTVEEVKRTRYSAGYAAGQKAGWSAGASSTGERTEP